MEIDQESQTVKAESRTYGGPLNTLIVDTDGKIKLKDGNEPRLWPSERIPPGGIFHTPKFEYCKETADLLKLLMKESKMSMMMRRKIDYHLRNGEPLPPVEPPRINTSADPDKNAQEIIKRARQAKRKSLERILASGAYDMPNYRPKPNDRTPSEKAKLQLQEAMAGVPLSTTSLKPKRRSRELADNIAKASPDQMINELLDQINERAEWLAEMEELGEGKKYRDEIREQIAHRLRQIKGYENKKKLQKLGFRYVD